MKLLSLALFVTAATASVSVRYTGQPPTGYEVTLRYYNATASNVTVGGGLLPFTDRWHTTPSFSAAYLPAKNYRPGDFYVAGLGLGTGNLGPGGNFTGYQMQACGNGYWELVSPFPSGTYSYAFLPDCPYGDTQCAATESGQTSPPLTFFIDGQNPPLESTPGEFNHSIFQVPFDPQYQYDPDLNLDFDFSLPVPKQHQGQQLAVNYSSPGSTYPAPDVHSYALYLPPGYDANASEPYPVLYLSHGGGGTAFDWPNLNRAFNIMDQLILKSWIPPTIVVCPGFYNLGLSTTPGVGDWAAEVRENYLSILLPHIESTYNAASDSDHRAFAGLSLGSELTYEMYINATDTFTYYGLFSGARGPPPSDTDIAGYINATMVAANPDLANRGVFTGFGNFDIAFPDMRALQLALEESGVGFLSDFVPWGSHFWNTWAFTLWNFGRTALWKPRPFNTQTLRAGRYVD